MTQLISLDPPERSFIWTAVGSDDSEMTSEDPLGLDYVAQQIGLLILPTLTTRSTRAQAYAMVMYGLALAERAIERFQYPATDETRRELFERWERFWALASFEYRDGQIPRGDWDAMRGVQGARKAWKPGDAPLGLGYPLISRQQELGSLGAYLAPLRRSGLVIDGGVKPGPAALDMIESFWDEPGDNRHRSRYDEYALAALEPGRMRIERKSGNLTLGRVGERSRLTSLTALTRTDQQARLYAALFERARDATTMQVCRLVELAAKASVTVPSEILDGAIAGRFGQIEVSLRDLLMTAGAFGESMQSFVGAFDRVYSTVERAGWMAASADVAAAAFGSADLEALRSSCARLLDAPAVSAIRRLPMHGGPFLRLVDELRTADAKTALDRLLAYHVTVQRDRRRGEGWIRDDAGTLVLVLTSYSARPEAPRFPSFKLGAVRTLLMDMGRLPFEAATAVPEVTA